jgi:hypothetical protein
MRSMFVGLRGVRAQLSEPIVGAVADWAVIPT